MVGLIHARKRLTPQQPAAPSLFGKLLCFYVVRIPGVLLYGGTLFLA